MRDSYYSLDVRGSKMRREILHFRVTSTFIKPKCCQQTLKKFTLSRVLYI
jgi:hypothetical protein